MGTIAARIQFGTKGETLERLAEVLRSARILPQVRFTVAEWKTDSAAVIGRLPRQWLAQPVIARSSALAEDGSRQSHAGHFTSVGNVLGEEALRAGVGQVIASFDAGPDANQIFIQPMLTRPALS